MGKNYMIVGASSGIGEACVDKLSEEAENLIIVARNKEKLNFLQSQYQGKINVVPVSYDVTDLDHINTVFTVCKEKKIKLDGLVYSAGMDGTWPIKINNTALMQEMMTVNCFGFVEMARNFYSKRFSADGASIVVVSSIASVLNETGMSAYCASKAALNSYVKTMSKEFVRRRIRVNAVLPAGVSTPMAEEKGILLSGLAVAGNGGENGILQDPQPLGMIPPNIVASQIAYLLSDQADYITGELLTMGAGRSY